MTNRERNILLIEDNQDDAELIQRALNVVKVKKNIVWLKDGQQALDYLYGKDGLTDRSLEVHPDFVLLDLKMPKISGLEVLKKMKATAATHNIPVVVLSSSQENNDLKAAYDLGVNSYVIKPINFKDLMQVTEQIGNFWLLINERLNTPK